MKRTIILTFLTSLLLLSLASASLNDDLVAYWPLDGNLTDVIGNTNVSVQAGAIVFSDGKIGQGMIVDPADRVKQDLLTANPLPFGNFNYTLCLFLNDSNANARNIFLYGDQTVASSHTSANFFGTPNEELTNSEHGSDGVMADVKLGNTGGELAHLCIVYTNDNLNATFYYNGSKADSKTHASPLAVTEPNRRIVLGNFNTGSSGTDGMLDEIGYWNRALTASEVAELAVGNISFPFAADPNNPPTTPTIVSPTGVAQVGDAILNATSTDVEGDPIQFRFFGNGTLLNTTNTSALFNFATAGQQLIEVDAFDGTDFSANASVVYTVTPIPQPPEIPLVRVMDLLAMAVLLVMIVVVALSKPKLRSGRR